jgi:hypothetical protein
LRIATSKVDGHSDPDLSFDGVFGGAEKRFDTKMLFDPLEEQLDLPAQAVELRNGAKQNCWSERPGFFRSGDL